MLNSSLYSATVWMNCTDRKEQQRTAIAVCWFSSDEICVWNDEIVSFEEKSYSQVQNEILVHKFLVVNHLSTFFEVF